jgi:hypothetical protein
MKKFLLAATVLSAVEIFSSAALAADVAPVPESQVGFTADIWAGYYFLGGSSGDADDDELKGDFPAIGADASVIFGAGDAFLMQGTAQGALNFLGSADDDQLETGWQVAAHAMHDSGIGVFGGLGEADYENDDKSDLWFIGGEFRHDFGAGNVLLQAGYLDSNIEDTAALADAWFVRLAPSFNVSDGVSAGLHAGYADGDIETEGDSGYVVSWGASFDYALDSAPVTLFVAYDGLYMDTSGAAADEHQVKAGIQISLGGLGDKEIDTPEIFRWVGIGQRSD